MSLSGQFRFPILTRIEICSESPSSWSSSVNDEFTAQYWMIFFPLLTISNHNHSPHHLGSHHWKTLHQHQDCFLLVDRYHQYHQSESQDGLCHVWMASSYGWCLGIRYLCWCLGIRHLTRSSPEDNFKYAWIWPASMGKMGSNGAEGKYAHFIF
jgi:hypothetical protein